MRHWLVVAVVMGLAAVDPGAVGAEKEPEPADKAL